mmetsp:Transcript_38804/g.90255  ORF Transcript_38804/g.90255 Transcript_38804/m.90255 type:complete len:898 (-) Transcript_38804:235-2928(-)
MGLPLRPIEESKERGDDDRSENDKRTRDVGIEIGDGDIVNFSKNARRALLERRNRARRISEARTRADAKAAEFSRWESLWERACVSGRNSCSVSISNGEENCGAAGGYLSDRFLRRYRAEFGRDLVSLSLVRHGLEKVPSGISSSCPSLRVLNLTCNRISSLDDDVTRLRHLEELRLSSNRLCEVPITIGRLGKVLKVLELGDNRLTSLPDSIGRLSEVRRLDVSGNSLSSLPSTLTDMSSLECMIASNNQITSLPVNIGDAENLQNITAVRNRIPHLPGSIGTLKFLETLHLSSNALISVPTSICNLLMLKSLWLCHNNLSALPHNFHNLRSLVNLRMEGNVSMVNPHLELIQEKGVDGIRKWSECRADMDIHVFRRNLVMALQDVLAKMDTVRKKGEWAGRVPLDSLLKSGVIHNEEEWYQFPESRLWSSFIPSLDDDKQEQENGNTKNYCVHFPYDRAETMVALEHFEDAAGRIMHKTRGSFDICSCATPCKTMQSPPKNDGLRQAHTCCTRNVLLVKKKLLLVREVAERKRVQAENFRIEENATIAEIVAKNFLKTEEGKEMVQRLAKTRYKEMKQAEKAAMFQEKSSAIAEYDRVKDEERLKKKRFQLRKKYDEKERYLLEKIQRSNKDNDDGAVINSRLEHEIDDLRKDYEKRLALLERQMEASVIRRQKRKEKIMKTWVDFKHRFLGTAPSEESKKVKHLIMNVETEFVEREVSTSRKKTMRNNETYRKVMLRWLDLCLYERFDAWKSWTKERLVQKRREVRAANQLARINYEDSLAYIVLANDKLQKWTEHWDDFNDMPFWVHGDTGETVWEEPVLELYLPEGFTHPTLPDCMVNKETCEPLSPKTVLLNELDTSDSDTSVDSFFSDFSSDSDSDENSKESEFVDEDHE